MQRTWAKIYKIEDIVGQARLEKIHGRCNFKGDNSSTTTIPNSAWIRNRASKMVHWTDYKTIGDNLWRIVILRHGSS